MKTVILAGGKGRRLAPYTTVFPKPLMPIGEMPILEIILRQLRHHGFKEIVMAVGHLSELLIAFFNDGKKLGMHIAYSKEDSPLGTAAPLKLIDNLHEPFIVMNGDVLSDINYRELYDQHINSKSIATIATYERSVNINFGVIKTGETNNILEYIEKPTYVYKVSMGIYVFNPEILKYIKLNEYLDFPDLIKIVIRDGKNVNTFPFNGYWLDIGRPDDYERAIEEFDKNKFRFLP